MIATLRVTLLDNLAQAVPTTYYLPGLNQLLLKEDI